MLFLLASLSTERLWCWAVARAGPRWLVVHLCHFVGEGERG